ncbi:MAG: hypothetical protein H0T89_19945 [Deltaproteobacteria bacterium]|nr:hypothetical protein [Deltaproteobacteria bacterium]MDQ3297110.1 hypothetical protein [Myxococcota bacterium]
MRKVVLSALLAYAATGCVAAEDAGLITANWSFKEVSTGAVLGCPAGFDTTAVYAYPVDGANQRRGQPIIDLYPCSAGTGTNEYPVDAYEVYLEITNSDNTQLYAQSTAAIVDITSRDATFTTTIIDDGGFFLFDWQLRGEVTGDPLSCAEALADSVDITSTLNGSTQAYTDVYPCSQGSAYTAALPAGDYTVSVAALDSSDRSISNTPALVNKRISAPNKITDLGLIMIPIVGE